MTTSSTSNRAARSADEPTPVAFSMPRADNRLCEWMLDAASIIASDPDRYHFTAAQCDELTRLARAFDEALSYAQSPGTRGPLTVQQKNAAREAAIGPFQNAVQQIRADPRIDVADKYALGFNPVKRSRRTPVAPPDSAPLLNILAAADGAHILTYADETTPHKRTKPKGAHALDLRIIIVPCGQGIEGSRDQGIQGVPHPDGPLPGAAIIRTERITRAPFTIEHSREHAGHTAIYFARWCTRTGKPGPWSAVPVSMTIAVIGPPAPGTQPPPPPQ